MESNKRVALILPVSGNLDNSLKRLPEDLRNRSENDDSRFYHFSSNGSFEALQETEKRFSMYSRCLYECTDIVIFKDVSFLYDNAFTQNWLQTIVYGNSPKQVYVEKSLQKVGQIDFSEMSLFKLGIKSRSVGEFNVLTPLSESPSFKGSLYPFIYEKISNFFDVFESYTQSLADNSPDKSANRTVAVNKVGALNYSLFGANQKSFILNQVINDLHDSNCFTELSYLDVGGGFGFLGLEMAMSGNDATVMDYDPAKHIVHEWLNSIAEPSGKFAFVAENMESLKLVRKYDVISFFGSLLYADRRSVSSILTECWNNLCPGGLLILHENPKGVGSPESLDYQIRFTSEEIQSYLSELSSKVRYYSMFTGNEIEFDQARKSVIMAVIQKNG